MRTLHKEPCFACGRKTAAPFQAFTWDDGGQEQVVGRDCRKWINRGGVSGWQPPRGGPRLFASREWALEYAKQVERWNKQKGRE